VEVRRRVVDVVDVDIDPSEPLDAWHAAIIGTPTPDFTVSLSAKTRFRPGVSKPNVGDQARAGTLRIGFRCGFASRRNG
jgi:hypothetical protein